MICVCLPTETKRYGWAVAGSYIAAELAKLDTVVDVSCCGVATQYDAPVLMAIAGENFAPLNRNPRGKRNVGYAFIERASMAALFVDKADAYDEIICGSTWMARQMSKIGVKNTSVAIQGVDHFLFDVLAPPPEDTPFTIFSGGKFEYRKGQDIVIAAFKIFNQRHPESRLICHWTNLWPETMRDMEQSKFIKYQHITSRAGWGWKTNALAALFAAGIPPEAIVLPKIDDHEQQASLYYSAHIGLFPNRGEAGTNLVMCEAIACGMPVIATHATGHLNITTDVPCYRIDDLTPVGKDDWWEPRDLEQILSHLEYAYLNRSAVREIGLCGAQTIESLVSWEKCAKKIHERLTC